ncbi:MAG: translation initiation factor IF-2 [Fimbriimonadaceae bacterium]|nr:translation initiation factor IF-2 [Fimbriimonadaceae bacterium]
MSVSIPEIAKEHGLVPGHVYGVLAELGIEHEGDRFEVDAEVLELIRVSLGELAGSKEIRLPHGRTPRDVSLALGVPQPEIQKCLIQKLKTMASVATVLKDDVAEKLVANFGYTVHWGEAPKPKPKPAAEAASAKAALARPPVVTIMGHVDHGKTSLLDYIRKTNVVAKEFGGITQHIGAYQVDLPEGRITFLDTPGHAAFTEMRARGAQVTDIAVLVVASDDGVMPQTIEAINHAKNAKVPIIVAVNKIDKPGARPDKVLQELTQYEVIPEAFGGDTITCNVSAITGEGVPQLLEMILLQAEVMQLTADPKGATRGVVVEAKLERGRGPVATVLVQEGTLRVGDAVAVTAAYGKIKAMTDYKGEKVDAAGPSAPVEILGLSEVPMAGDTVIVVKSERDAREIAEQRKDDDRLKDIRQAHKPRMTLRGIREKLTQGESKELLLVIKADVQGSVEAVRGLIEKIENEEVEVKIIHYGVGSVTESDVLLASASDAIVVGFNVKPEGKAKAEAERHKVEIRTYNIIYELIDDIHKAVKGMLEPKFEEMYLGTVDIRVKFDFSRKGVIAGCYVTDGKVTRNARCRVKRGREVVFEGAISSLKHLKDDVREATVGFECGITFDGWQDFQVGDQIEAYEMVQIND